MGATGAGVGRVRVLSWAPVEELSLPPLRYTNCSSTYPSPAP